MKHFLEELKLENAKRLKNGKTIIEPFYPYDFLKSAAPVRKGARPSDERDGLPKNTAAGDLASFVFLKADASDIAELVNESQNRGLSSRLTYYLDTDGTRATVRDGMMQAFLQACMEHKDQFEIAPSVRSIEVMDKVRFKSGPFAGMEASVVQVRLKQKSVHLEVAIQLVSGIMNIRMNNVTRSQIEILDRGGADAIRADFIEYTQNHLLRILEHRIRRVDDKETTRRDADMLTRLYRYRYHEVENAAARYHFLALMLMCAHLCQYKSEEAQLLEQARGALNEINQRSESKAATDARTYLWIALYLSTREPAYRDAAKQYVRDHQPKSVKLRRLVTLIRTGVKV